MARRPDITVITLLNQELVRTDFRKNFQVPSFQVLEQVDVEASVGAAIESVLVGHPKPAYKTIFVCSQIWSQVVALPSSSVNGIPEEELQEALKFEAETLSGIEIDQIAIAYSQLSKQDEFHRFWVSAIPKDDLDEVHSILFSYGCRDIFVAHPAGLSHNKSISNRKSVVEVWENLSYQMQPQAGKLLGVRQVDLIQIPAQSTVLDASGLDLDWEQADSSVTVRVLDQKEIFQQWVSLIADNYRIKKPELNVPLIRFTKGSTEAPVRHFVSALIASATLGFCLWHYFGQKEQIANLKGQIASVKKPAADKSEYDLLLKKVLADRQTLEGEDEKTSRELMRVQFFLDHQRDRIQKLLQMLVDIRTDDLVVNQIGSSEDGVTISGFMVNGKSAQTLATGLRERAGDLGWDVNPAVLTGQQKLTTGGPWDFVIVLSDVGPDEPVSVNLRVSNGTAKKTKIAE